MAIKKKESSKKKSNKIPEYNLGERLRFLRESRRLTQSSLSEASGISQASIAHIEKGTKDPSVKTLNKIAQALDVHVATLFTSQDVHVFDLKRLRRKYNSVDQLTPHLYMALGKVVQFSRDIDFLK